MIFRKRFARITFVLALISLAWLILGIFELAPLILHIPGETNLRAHASVTHPYSTQANFDGTKPSTTRINKKATAMGGFFIYFLIFSLIYSIFIFKINIHLIS